MKESSEKQTDGLPKKGVVPLLLSREFRWIYFMAIGFLVLVSGILIFVGSYNFRAWLHPGFSDERVSLTSAILPFCGGLFALILAFGVRQMRKYFNHLYEVTVAEIKSVELGNLKVELSNIKEGDFEKIDRIQQLR